MSEVKEGVSLNYEKGSKEVVNTGNYRNSSYSKKNQHKYGELVVEFSRNSDGEVTQSRIQ